MRCSLQDSLVWLYSDSEVGARPCSTIALDVARGGTAAVTILVNDARPGVPIQLALSPAPKVWTAYRLVDVPVEQNTGFDGFCERDGQVNPHVTRKAPFRVFDALEPVDAAGFKATAATQALRIHVPVMRTARPGVKQMVCAVTHGDAHAVLKIRLTIHAVQMPPAGVASFPYTNWYSVINMAERHGLKPWSEGHWRMIRRYADLMCQGRQNTFIVPLSLIFSRDKNGAPALNRPRLRRWVRTFTEAGLHYIEGGHFGGRTGKAWEAPTFSIGLTQSLATSPEGNADIAAIAGQLMEEIDRNDWWDRWIQHVADEPIAANAADYRIFVGMIRKYMPGVPILDATLEESLVGSVDMWCPQVQSYQHNRARFERMQALGDEVWSYTCCFPGGPWLNRLLDMELLRPALIGWASALFKLDGFLHWGFNQYQKQQNPFEMNVVPNWGGGSNALPPGDTHIVYPGASGPWSSVRFESHREGLEDLELLQILQARHPLRARALMRPVIRGFDDYTKDAAVLRAARRKLLQALS